MTSYIRKTLVLSLLPLFLATMACTHTKKNQDEDFLSEDYSFGPKKPHKDRYYKKGKKKSFD